METRNQDDVDFFADWVLVENTSSSTATTADRLGDGNEQEPSSCSAEVMLKALCGCTLDDGIPLQRASMVGDVISIDSFETLEPGVPYVVSTHPFVSLCRDFARGLYVNGTKHDIPPSSSDCGPDDYILLDGEGDGGVHPLPSEVVAKVLLFAFPCDWIAQYVCKRWRAVWSVHVRLQRAHLLKEMRTRCEEDGGTLAILHPLPLLKWGFKVSGRVAHSALPSAAYHANMQVIEWALGRDHEVYTIEIHHFRCIAKYAAWGGHVELLQWLHDCYEERCFQPKDIYAAAGKSGSVEVLEWIEKIVEEHRVAIRKRFRGLSPLRLDAPSVPLQLLNAHRSWRRRAIVSAASFGKVGVLMYAEDNAWWTDASMVERACRKASMNGRIEILKWLSTNHSSEWRRSCGGVVAVHAAQRGDVEMLRWVGKSIEEDSKRQFDGDILIRCARGGNLEAIEYVLSAVPSVRAYRWAMQSRTEVAEVLAKCGHCETLACLLDGMRGMRSVPAGWNTDQWEDESMLRIFNASLTVGDVDVLDVIWSRWSDALPKAISSHGVEDHSHLSATMFGKAYAAASTRATAEEVRCDDDGGSGGGKAVGTALVMDHVASRGNAKVLLWAREKGMPWTPRVAHVCVQRAKKDRRHIELLRCALEHGCPMDNTTRKKAMKHHLLGDEESQPSSSSSWSPSTLKAKWGKKMRW